MHLIFDTETNGLPITASARYSEVSNWPRILQLSWGLYNDAGELVDSRTSFIKPNGWTVPNSPFFVEHNYTTERCAGLGIPIEEALTGFLQAWAQADVIVAHNLAFDRPVLFAELVRAEKKLPNKNVEYYCTKLHSEPICKIQGYGGKYKWPTLTEAHEWFFKEGFEGAHDAKADVEACARVYFKCLEYEAMLKEFG